MYIFIYNAIALANALKEEDDEQHRETVRMDAVFIESHTHKATNDTREGVSNTPGGQTHLHYY